MRAVVTRVQILRDSLEHGAVTATDDHFHPFHLNLPWFSSEFFSVFMSAEREILVP
jgi:hypothetical protein